MVEYGLKSIAVWGLGNGIRVYFKINMTTYNFIKVNYMFFRCTATTYQKESKSSMEEVVEKKIFALNAQNSELSVRHIFL